MRKMVIDTPLGKLIPFYEITDGRQKNRPSVEYYKSGALYSVYLQEQTVVKTPAGDMPAELITFYESGAVKRVFPLYGQLSSYWNVEDEIENAPEYVFAINGQNISIRPQCIYFYPSGKIRSITLWPVDTITVNTPVGTVTSKLGIEVYEDKTIRSIEPAFGTVLSTRYGDARPFMVRKHMMHAEDASMRFGKEGNLESFATLQTKVEVDGETYKAGDYRSPLIICFGTDMIEIRGAHDLNRRINTLQSKVRFS